MPFAALIQRHLAVVALAASASCLAASAALFGWDGIMPLAVDGLALLWMATASAMLAGWVGAPGYLIALATATRAAGFVAAAAAAVLIPPGLLWALIWFETATVAGPAAFWAVFMALAVCSGVALTRPAVTATLPPPPWPHRLPMLAGAGLTALLILEPWLAVSGQSRDLAESMAEAQLGRGYQYRLTSIGRSSENGLPIVTGVVMAWSATEIRQVILRWRER